MTNDIDITELLEYYASCLENGNIPRSTIERKIMLQASEEIQKLRKQLEVQIELTNNKNNSRLKLHDVIHNCRNLYESTCKDVRETTGEDYVCGMCKYDCDCSVGESGDYLNECPGFERDDCFELDINKYNRIVFERQVE